MIVVHGIKGEKLRNNRFCRGNKERKKKKKNFANYN